MNVTILGVEACYYCFSLNRFTDTCASSYLLYSNICTQPSAFEDFTKRSHTNGVFPVDIKFGKWYFNKV